MTGGSGNLPPGCSIGASGARGPTATREQELEERVRRLEAQVAYLKIDGPEGGARLTNREKALVVAEIFGRLPNGVGHRQIAMELRAVDGVRVAGKTVPKIMRELGLACGIRRGSGRRRYGSYRGVVGETFENVLGRDFSADAPRRKMGADVTEFRCSFGKAYLAPVCDFASKEIVAHSVSRHPDMAQQREMLGMLVAAKPEGARPRRTA